MEHEKTNNPDRNPDPITKTPGSHPVGTGVGAAVGGAAGIGGAAATGAVVGSGGGPVGTAVGAAAGAVVGGLVGKGVGEKINPTEEERYWRENYSTRPYVTAGMSYDEYSPAYQYGWESYQKQPNKRFDDIEASLAGGWERAKGKSQLKWDRAKQAARDAWDRVAARKDKRDQHRTEH